MSLELYPSQERAMLNAQSSYFSSQRDTLKKQELAYLCFIEDTLFKGRGWQAAKDLAARTFIPAIRGLAEVCRILEDTNNQVLGILAQYPWQNSVHVSESNLSLEYDNLCKSKNQLILGKNVELYRDYIIALDRTIVRVEDRIVQMKSYDYQTAGLYTEGGSLQALMQAIEEALASAQAIIFDEKSQSFSAPGVDWSFEVVLSQFSSLLGDEERLTLEFYQSLPTALKAVLTIYDFVATADGFVFCTKALSEILIAGGLSLSDIENEDYQTIYLFGLKDPKGGFEYSVMEIVLPGHVTKASGISLPFISLDINVFEGLNNEGLDGFREVLNKVLFPETTDNFSQLLINYFKDPKTKASYFIADYAVTQALARAGITDKGSWEPGTIDTIMQGDRFTAKALEKLQEKGIVDIAAGRVHIKDVQNLSFDEKSAVLACITSNPDLYSYAAENQFHADFFALGKRAASVPSVPPLSPSSNPLFPPAPNPFLANPVTEGLHTGGDFLAERAIVSNAGVGESVDYYEFLFKKQELDIEDRVLKKISPAPAATLSYNPYYSQQYKAHG